MTNKLAGAALKFLAAFALDAILLAIGIVSASAQVALLLLCVGIILALGLLFLQRWRYVGLGMIVWATLGIATEVILLVTFGGGE
jgi:hypothetical protein